MPKRQFFPFFLAIVIGCGCSHRAPQTVDPREFTVISYSELVERMMSLERLALLPPSGESSGMASSYDRSSRYDAETDSFVDWAANLDGDGFVREEDGGIVLADLRGPGCIWRIWSAMAGQGHVRIYIDGAEKPVVDRPFEQYFDCSSEPFTYPELAYVASKGKNLYFPIPYQVSCKIVAEEGWGKYFHANFTTFEHLTLVPSFSLPLDADTRHSLDRLTLFFRENLGEDPAPKRKDAKIETRRIAARPGQTTQVMSLGGPSMITAIRVRPEFDAGADSRKILRALALRITFDQQAEPSVWAPLGDFFGSAPGVVEFSSLPLSVGNGEFTSLLVMPFEKAARIEVENADDFAHELEFEIVHAPIEEDFEPWGYFHAKWHRGAFTVDRADRWPDWTVLKTRGRGRFCGMVLEVWNPIAGSSDESKPGDFWWGEGDEKFFVDAEPFPSTFGTGTEDYFGYAWCDPRPFEKPYHGQVYTDWNAGHQTLYRWQIADSVPFQSSFQGYIEKYFPEDRPTQYAAMVYWYLDPKGEDPYKPVPFSERYGYETPAGNRGAGFEVLGQTKGWVRGWSTSHYEEGTWDKDDHLWWRMAEPGDRLRLGVRVEEEGQYALQAVLTRGPGYGIVQLSLDGEPVGGEIDLYSRQVRPLGPLDFGERWLAAGEHELAIDILGANDLAEKEYYFAIDQFLVRKLD